MKNVKINNINNDKNDRHPDLSNTINSYLPSHRSIALSEHTGKSEKISSAAWKVVAILSLIATMVTYAETMLIPAIPDLIRDFHVSYNASSWLMTMYLVAGAVMTPIAGKLSDIYGRKKILLMIMVIYTIGVTVAASSSTFYAMLIARSFQGVGMGMFPIAYTMIRSQFPRNKISIGQGIITSMYASGSVIGLVVGPRRKDMDDDLDEVKNDNNVGIDPNKIKRQHLDIKGAVTLAVVIVSILLVFTFLQPPGENLTASSSASFVNNRNYSTMITISFAILGTSSFVGFLLVERRAQSPLLDLKLVANKVILPGNLVMLVIGMTMFMVMQTIPILARSPNPLGFGDSVIEATKIQIPYSIILLVSGPTSGFIVSKMGSRTPMIAGTIITTIGFFAIYAFHSTQLFVSIGLAVVSVGLSFAAVGVMNIIILATPAQSMGISTGMTSLIRIIGSALGPAIAGMLMQSQQQILKMNGSTTAATFPSSGAYNLIFLTAAILSVFSIAFAIMAGKKRDVGKAAPLSISKERP